MHPLRLFFCYLKVRQIYSPADFYYSDTRSGRSNCCILGSPWRTQFKGSFNQEGLLALPSSDNYIANEWVFFPGPTGTPDGWSNKEQSSSKLLQCPVIKLWNSRLNAKHRDKNVEPWKKAACRQRDFNIYFGLTWG